MVPVDSSNVAALGYDEPNQELLVRFTNGALYRYFPGVPRSTYESLLSADNVGRALNSLVKSSYSYSRIE